VLILALFLAGYAIIVELLGIWRKRPVLNKSAANAGLACWLCLTVASAVLLVALVRGDFSIRYVAEHTSRALPLLYRISAFWAGAAGSLLLWLWLQTGFILAALFRVQKSQGLFIAVGRAVGNFLSAFFLVILIVDKSPFALSSPVPADGAGLNPLLQHPAMALHPPTLFAGYAGLAIPFLWAFAVLATGRQHSCPLLVQVRKWTLIAWLFLTTGIALGAWWAYEELGWGGYWAWDPVENSSLLPWLTATALLHCFRTYRSASPIATWLVVLCLLTYSLCIFGTFLTRYGLVSSVHAFPEPGFGILFMVLLAILWATAAVMLWGRSSQRSSGGQVRLNTAARLIVINNWLMVLLVIVILVGTLFPFFSGILTGHKISLKSDYFTKITSLPGLLLLFLLGLCPHLWIYGLNRNWRTIGAVISAAAAVGGWLLAGTLAVPYFIICGFASVNIAADFSKRLKRTLHWYGTRLTHAGVVLIFIGIAGSGAYEIAKEAALKPHQTVSVGSYDFHFANIEADHGPNFTAVTARIEVRRNKELIATLKPSQAYYHDSNKQTSEVDIKRSLAGDIYVALTAVDKSNGLINLRVLIKPFINWIWIGSAAMVLGAVMVIVSYAKQRAAAAD